MAKAFRITKKTNWTTLDNRSGMTISVAHAGRVLTCNPEDFEGLAKILPATPAVPASGTGANRVEEVPAKPEVLLIEGALEVVAETYTNDLGEKRTGLRLKPKFDLEVNSFGF